MIGRCGRRPVLPLPAAVETEMTDRRPADAVEWLAVIQHQGSPTRLLDFTRTPFVASYFALEAPPGGDFGCVWAVERLPLSVRVATVLSGREPSLGRPGVVLLTERGGQ